MLPSQVLTPTMPYPLISKVTFLAISILPTLLLST